MTHPAAAIHYVAPVPLWPVQPLLLSAIFSDEMTSLHVIVRKWADSTCIGAKRSRCVHSRHIADKSYLIFVRIGFFKFHAILLSSFITPSAISTRKRGARAPYRPRLVMA